MTSLPPKKKSKSKPKYSLKELKTLGQQLLSSRAHINNLPILLTFISPSSTPQYALESLLSLQPFFLALLSDLPPASSKPLINEDNDSTKDPELVYKVWLRSKFDEFVKSLIALAVSPQSDETLRDVALDAIMEFVKRGKDGRFQSVIYHRFLHTIVHSSWGVDVLLESLASKYFKYIDVSYFTYISLEKLAKSLEPTDINGNNNVNIYGDSEHISRSSNVELTIHKIHYILSHISPFEMRGVESDYEMWSTLGLLSKEADGNKPSEVSQGKDLKNKTKKPVTEVMPTSRIAKKMKLKFTKAWLSFLRLPLPLEVYKEVLATLHQAVIPHLSNPIILCDFLTRSYDIGGVISVMALSSLFILMTQHGLEYPNFYEKLYLLLVPSIFMAKHRAKFFQLLDSCMRSSLLPAYLAAAFTKKLSRVALVVPPSGALVIIALIYNLLRRHPSINCLVHWQTDDRTDGDVSRGDTEFSDNVEESATSPDISNKKRGIDPFNAEESNPAKSNAMRSSLWEIDTLRNHYCPAVSRFVASLENDLTVRSKTTELMVKDFSSGSYATIFGNEIRRRVKQVPLAFYKAIPASLFSASDFTGWSFSLEEAKKEESGNDENGVLTIPVEDQKSKKRQRIEHS